jgi:hypothetical protein
MVAYSFQRRFIEPILAGTKGGTIRAERKGRNLGHRVVSGGHAYPGDELQLYTGMRTKYCQLIARRQCIAVDQITLHFRRDTIFLGEATIIDTVAGKDEFARFDGFQDWSEMRLFWGDTTVFLGWHIRWLEFRS